MKILPIQNTFTYTKKNISPVKTDNTFICNKEKSITQLPNFYYKPINFGKDERGRDYSSIHPELFEYPKDFRFTKFEDIPCPACGKKMMTLEKFTEFQQRLEKTQPDQYLYLLGEYKDYMRPIEESVYNEIKALAYKQGTTDIRKLLVCLRQSKLPHLQAIQRKKLIQMKKIARTLPAEERATLSKKLSELGQQIKRKNEEAPFRRKKMIQEIKDIKISNKFKYEKLQNLAKAFPTSKDTNSAWIIKYSGKNKYNQDWQSKEIAERMMLSSIPNVDHILPYNTERGHDDISNYMSMHTGCNTQKSHKPFMQWYNENPQLRQRSLNAYFSKCNQLIEAGKIEDARYKDYVAYATDTIEHVSKGQVSIQLDTKPEEITYDLYNDGEDINIAVEQ